MVNAAGRLARWPKWQRCSAAVLLTQDASIVGITGGWRAADVSRNPNHFGGRVHEIDR